MRPPASSASPPGRWPPTSKPCRSARSTWGMTRGRASSGNSPTTTTSSPPSTRRSMIASPPTRRKRKGSWPPCARRAAESGPRRKSSHRNARSTRLARSLPATRTCRPRRPGRRRPSRTSYRSSTRGLRRKSAPPILRPSSAESSTAATAPATGNCATCANTRIGCGRSTRTTPRCMQRSPRVKPRRLMRSTSVTPVRARRGSESCSHRAGC